MTSALQVQAIAAGSTVLIVSLWIYGSLLVWRIAARLWRHLLKISLRPSGQLVN